MVPGSRRDASQILTLVGGDAGSIFPPLFFVRILSELSDNRGHNTCEQGEWRLMPPAGTPRLSSLIHK
jgi:hypothetical protein